jgi:hypothetical protein
MYGGTKVCPNDETHQLWTCGGIKKHVFCAKCQKLGVSKGKGLRRSIVKVVESVTTKKTIKTVTTLNNPTRNNNKIGKRKNDKGTMKRNSQVVGVQVNLFNSMNNVSFPTTNAAMQNYWTNPSPTPVHRNRLL